MEITNLITEENISFIVTLLFGASSTCILVFKKRLNSLKNFIDKLIEANKDNTITSEEFTGLLEAGKQLLK